MFESLSTVAGALPWICQGALITIGAIACAMSLGFLLGVPMAVAQVYGPPFLSRAVGLYVWFFRGVPILVLLYLFYFGLAYQMGLDISPFGASCLVLGLTSASYQSQIFRGGICSLPSGQLKAARALGMSDISAIRSIILPQALRLSIPGWSNEYSIILKDSALAFALGAPEIMARTHFVATRTYTYLPLYITAGVL